MIDDDSEQLPPLPQPSQNPNNPPLTPGHGNSLAGYCTDYDHSQFQRAKDFAYSSNGLNMDSNAAIQYASARVETVTVQQANQMRTTLGAVINFAYSSNGLNYDSNRAKEYAVTQIRKEQIKLKGVFPCLSPHQKLSRSLLVLIVESVLKPPFP